MRSVPVSSLRRLGLAAAAILLFAQSPRLLLRAQCGPNPVVCENLQTGNPKIEWDVVGAGDSTLQGFATDISVNKGSIVTFKVSTTATIFSIDIYRLGYYGGMGARKIATLPSISGQNQPACLTVTATQLVDCGNWAATTTWSVPSTAISGIYLAKLIRPDTGGASHIVFIVRDDSSTSDVLFQTSDTTWQAYNQWGGASLYLGAGAPARKVSYNRPFATRGQSGGFGPSNWVFYAEYPAVRWLEANGYNVTYTAGVDGDRSGALIKNHKVFLSVGHDEYWSAGQRTSVEAARDAGVHLAFLSGNEMYWKTRWEPSIDGTNTAYRTLVCYKETAASAKIDPLGSTWTGTWRDPRFSPPGDGDRPENAVTGQASTVNRGSGAITVPDAEGKLRLWRNTAAATLSPGQKLTLAGKTLGYEWDEDLDNGSRPAGLIRLSSTTVNVPQHLVDFGNTFVPATVTHALTLYRHSSGALVFGAGTVQWVWGLDASHDNNGPDQGDPTPDINIQQATLNLLADMNVQAATRQPGLSPASPSADAYAPTSSITAPSNGAVFPASSPITITGTASDASGLVAGVEVSIDGGATWHPAVGRENWSYTWLPGTLGPATIMTRAADDSGNIETAGAGRSVTIGEASCPCTIWPNSVTPWQEDSNDNSTLEVGVKFTSDIDGSITGLRFYKSSANTGLHIGHLWTAGGQLLASATFTSESSSGWQQVALSAPVTISAGGQYVASYQTSAGHYSFSSYFFGKHGVDQWPLHALSNAAAGGNAVYSYGTGVFPTQSYLSGNYWVDVVFMPNGPDTAPPTVTSVTPASGAANVSTATTVTATFNETLTASTINATTFLLLDNSNVPVAATVTYNANTSVATLTPTAVLTSATTYTAKLIGGSSGVKDTAGNPLAGPVTWTFTTTPAASGCPCSVWSASATPAVAAANDSSPVELGMRFRTDTAGTITGVRFYKGATNTGVHTGSLWTNSGTLLATATFAGEGASGWQQVTFSSPVAVAANTTYVVSYHTNTGHYSYSSAYFAAAGVDNAPLHALANGIDGATGLYLYSSGAFPTQSYNSTNYWVDVVFMPNGPDTTPPTVTSLTPASGASNVSTATTVTATFNETLTASTINATTFLLLDNSNVPVAATVTYNANTSVATLTPTAVLTSATTYTAKLIGGSSGVKDTAGNPLAGPVTWTFTTTPAVSGCPCSVWNASATPAVAAANDSSPVELGMRFRTDTAGTITGVRFYKGATNTGVHTGSLWTNSGTLLATATFAGEGASGWQQVTFSSPVAVAANTTYVVSYHTDAGHYSYSSAFFAAAGVDNAPLHALANGVDGVTGLYLYGAGGFPTQSYNSTNYWVDVVFMP